MGKFLLKLLKYLLKFIDDLPIIGAARKFAKFKPKGKLNKSHKTKFNNNLCFGFQIILNDKYNYRSLNSAINSIYINFGLYPDNIRFDKEKSSNELSNSTSLTIVTSSLLK